MAGIITPSYRSGFAAPTRLRNYAYPSLWRGCVGAWCPSLGATGSRLFDQSGYGNHGTLTNMEPATDWVVAGSGGALDIDQVNESVPCGTTPNVFSAGVTISLWAYRPAATSTLHFYNFFSTRRGSDNATPFSFDIEQTSVTGGVRFYLNNAGFNIWRSNSSFYSAASVPNQLIHVAVTYVPSTQPRFFLRGVSVGSTQTAGSSSPAILYTATTQTIGWFNGASGNDMPFGGQLDDIRIYNRALTLPEIQLLSRRRGIAYEMDDEVYKFPSAAFQAAWARRTAGMIGAGV